MTDRLVLLEQRCQICERKPQLMSCGVDDEIELGTCSTCWRRYNEKAADVHAKVLWLAAIHYADNYRGGLVAMLEGRLPLDALSPTFDDLLDPADPWHARGILFELVLTIDQARARELDKEED